MNEKEIIAKLRCLSVLQLSFVDEVFNDHIDERCYLADVARYRIEFSFHFRFSVNDRITSANGVNLDNVDYNTAVRIMKESEHLNLVCCLSFIIKQK